MSPIGDGNDMKLVLSVQQFEDYEAVMAEKWLPKMTCFYCGKRSLIKKGLAGNLNAQGVRRLSVLCSKAKLKNGCGRAQVFSRAMEFNKVIDRNVQDDLEKLTRMLKLVVKPQLPPKEPEVNILDEMQDWSLNIQPDTNPVPNSDEECLPKTIRGAQPLYEHSTSVVSNNVDTEMEQRRISEAATNKSTTSQVLQSHVAIPPKSRRTVDFVNISPIKKLGVQLNRDELRREFRNFLVERCGAKDITTDECAETIAAIDPVLYWSIKKRGVNEHIVLTNLRKKQGDLNSTGVSTQTDEELGCKAVVHTATQTDVNADQNCAAASAPPIEYSNEIHELKAENARLRARMQELQDRRLGDKVEIELNLQAIHHRPLTSTHQSSTISDKGNRIDKPSEKNCTDACTQTEEESGITFEQQDLISMLAEENAKLREDKAELADRLKKESQMWFDKGRQHEILYQESQPSGQPANRKSKKDRIGGNCDVSSPTPKEDIVSINELPDIPPPPAGKPSYANIVKKDCGIDNAILKKALVPRRQSGKGTIKRFHVCLNIPKRLTPTKKQRYLAAYAILRTLGIREYVSEISLVGNSILEVYVHEFNVATVKSVLRKNNAPTIEMDPEAVLLGTTSEEHQRRCLTDRLAILCNRNPSPQMRAAIFDGISTQTRQIVLNKMNNMNDGTKRQL